MGIVALARVILPEPAGGTPEAAGRRDCLVEVPLHAVLPVVRHLHIVRLEFAGAGVHGKHLLPLLNARITQEDGLLAAQGQEQNAGSVVVDVVIECAVELRAGRAEALHPCRAEFIDVARPENHRLCREARQQLHKLIGAVLARLPRMEVLERGEIVVQRIHRQVMRSGLHDVVEAGNVIQVRVAEEPAVHVRDLLARDALQPADEVVGILRKAAVHDKDLAVLGGDDKAVHLGSGHAVQHDDTVLAIGGIHDRISFFCMW